jgi:metacaspase-1
MRRHALLFGLNYDGTRAQLRGCENDARSAASFLADNGFQCTALCDARSTTRRGIMGSLRALAAAAEDGDSVWIHYSGHGTRALDRDGDERDGFDECLVPSDFKLIPDDAVATTLMAFGAGCSVIFVADCCHSGTIADLPYSWCAQNEHRERESRNPFRGRIVCLSGCLDSQTSADAFLYSKYSGAMTTFLLESLRDPRNGGRIMEVVRDATRRLRACGFEQRPVVTSSFPLTESDLFFDSPFSI